MSDIPGDGWKHSGVRVIPAGSLDTNTPQTPGMNRAAAINFARVGAQKIWAGLVSIHPNAKTGAHHHGHAVDQDDLMTPIELIGFARFVDERHVGFG